MTTSPGPYPDLAVGRLPHEIPPKRPWTWRSWVALAVWLAIPVGLVVLYTTFGELLGVALGGVWGGDVAVDRYVPVYWSFAVTSGMLGVAAAAALFARRWVAMMLALLLFGVGGFFALSLYRTVEPIVAPVEHVDPGPLPCACYSGSPCECPGG